MTDVRFPDLIRLQNEHQAWQEHNFPDADPLQQLVGVMEEVGELSHATLKAHQRIRQFRDGYQGDTFRIAAEDAIGDIIVYLAGFCNLAGISLAHSVELAWTQVKVRDWVEHPEDAHSVGGS